MARLEIVDYLRSYAGGALELVAHKRADEAADEITRLREENARLREALEEALPFVRIKGMWSEEIHDRIAAAIREGGKDGKI